jgi:uncharacterized protein (TIGR02118 family)
MRMVVTYRRPQDRFAFDRDYFGVHVPMAKRLPGLKRYVVSKANPSTSADEPYLIATLDFDSPAAIQAALEGDVGRACWQAGSKVEIEVAGRPIETSTVSNCGGRDRL